MVKIDSMKFGEITIDGKAYYSDMTVWWDGRTEYREKSHSLDTEEFSKIAARKPEIVVVGTGTDGVLKISDATKSLAEEMGIELFSDLSPKAIEMFNAFQKEGKRAVAIIHATC